MGSFFRISGILTGATALVLLFVLPACGPGVDLIRARAGFSPVSSVPKTTLSPGLYDQRVMALSPVAYWRLDDFGGTQAYDLSGHGNHGTYQGSISLGANQSPFGSGSPVFSGAGYVTLPSGLVENAKTIEAWVSTTASAPGVVVGYQGGLANGPSLNGWSLALYLTNSAFAAGEVYVGNSNSPPMGSSPLNDGFWHHLVLVIGNTEEYLYVDGTRVAHIQGPPEGGHVMHDNQIGTGYSASWGDAPGGWFPFTGSISNVAIYSQAMDEASLVDHFQAAGR